jgi:hypothetical protein
MEHNLSSPPQGPNLETVEPVTVRKLDAGTGDSFNSVQLTVKLVSDERPTLGKWLKDNMRNLWRDTLVRVLIIFLSIAVLAFILQRVIFFPTLRREDPVGQLSVFAQYPKWIALFDEEAVSITLLNTGSTDLTDVKILLDFKDALCVLTDSEGSTIVEFENLAAGERKTKTAHFRLERVNPGCPVEVQAQVIATEQSKEGIPSPYTIRVIFAPYFKTLTQVIWAGLMGILGVVLGGVGLRLLSVLGLEKYDL